MHSLKSREINLFSNITCARYLLVRKSFNSSQIILKHQFSFFLQLSSKPWEKVPSPVVVSPLYICQHTIHQHATKFNCAETCLNNYFHLSIYSSEGRIPLLLSLTILDSKHAPGFVLKMPRVEGWQSTPPPPFEKFQDQRLAQ